MMPSLRVLSLVTLVSSLVAAAVAGATHTSGGCTTCASHKYWPMIDGITRRAEGGSVTYVGTERSDELLGHHGSDTLKGRGSSDVLWGDWDGAGQPASQRDRISGGPGDDFIYGSHGHNRITGGSGNDAISVHYGRGYVNCGPGNDIYHVARSRRKRYRFRNCEKVDYRPEKVRGGGLRPLP